MEITLEKIELVKDRTGVSYKEAKEALEAANGSVVDAIINIEETINMEGRSKLGTQSTQILDRIKELVKKGNVSRILVKKDGEAILNLPLNVGILGTVLAPWAALAGVIAAFGTKCVIELVKDDGEVVEISERAADTLGDVIERGVDFVDDVREKGADVIDSVRAKTQEAVNRTRRNAGEDEEEDGGDASESYEEYVSTEADAERENSESNE
ncbi:MAG: DUF4342 domain-containing protein [Clostridiales Family XIII bacterium]|jgi:hypothetical protein|nr:DUF4342 domain-containing protein [Clostridiales Family XIII bacterium]